MSTSTTGEAGIGPAPAASQRSLLIDVVRGIAIVLVVLGHTNQGNIHRGWWGDANTGHRIENAIYAFHMPAFFFVSGIFLRPGVDKRGEWSYTLGKLRTMIYPYLLWALLIFGAEHLFSRFMATGILSVHNFLIALVTANFSWFLPTIFLVVMAGMLLRKLPMPLVFALAVLAQLFIPATGASDIDGGIKNLPFLLLGMWVGRAFTRFEAVPRALAGIGALALAGVMVACTRQLTYVLRPTIVPLGILGIVMLLLAARALDRSAPARWFAWAGEGSFGIFLMSEFPQGASRELIHRLFHTTAPWPHLLVTTAVAVVIPGWIYQHREKLKLGWLFVWPFR
ncbi:MAG: acyltransferase family protein [Janthinobacterium lividum]